MCTWRRRCSSVDIKVNCFQRYKRNFPRMKKTEEKEGQKWKKEGRYYGRSPKHSRKTEDVPSIPCSSRHNVNTTVSSRAFLIVGSFSTSWEPQRLHLKHLNPPRPNFNPDAQRWSTTWVVQKVISVEHAYGILKATLSCMDGCFLGKNPVLFQGRRSWHSSRFCCVFAVAKLPAMLGAPTEKEKIPSMWMSHIGPTLSTMYMRLFGPSSFSWRISLLACTFPRPLRRR